MTTPPAHQHALAAESWRARTRWRNRLGAAIFLLLIALLAWADHRGWFLYAGDDWQRYHQRTFIVTLVDDGDRLEIAATDGPYAHTRVKLWGVECPLVAKPQRGLGAQPFADQAAALSKNRVLDQPVRLELQRQKLRDHRGLILAYVYPIQGPSLNQQLLEAGLAAQDTQNSHDQLQAFHDAQQRARDAKLGIWSLPARLRKIPLPLEAAGAKGMPPTTAPGNHAQTFSDTVDPGENSEDEISMN